MRLGLNFSCQKTVFDLLWFRNTTILQLTLSRSSIKDASCNKRGGGTIGAIGKAQLDRVAGREVENTT